MRAPLLGWSRDATNPSHRDSGYHRAFLVALVTTTRRKTAVRHPISRLRLAAVLAAGVGALAGAVPAQATLVYVKKPAADDSVVYVAGDDGSKRRRAAIGRAPPLPPRRRHRPGPRRLTRRHLDRLDRQGRRARPADAPACRRRGDAGRHALA